MTLDHFAVAPGESGQVDTAAVLGGPDRPDQTDLVVAIVEHGGVDDGAAADHRPDLALGGAGSDLRRAAAG
jgi:hypothetical protein